MNIPPSEAGALDLWTYEALVFAWNEALTRDTDDVDAPDPEIAMRVLDKANRDERLIH
jgi:hypothetical protein